jgi:hypothetical protein
VVFCDDYYLLWELCTLRLFGGSIHDFVMFFVFLGRKKHEEQEELLTDSDFEGGTCTFLC